MKILCVCAGGNTRSVTFATLLKYYWHHDALAASVEKNTAETLYMLLEWADEIIVADPYIATRFQNVLYEQTELLLNTKPIRLLDLGRDQWGMSMHPELIPIAYQLLVDTYGPAPRKKPVGDIILAGGKYEARRTGTGAASSGPVEEITGEGTDGGGDSR